MATAQFSAFNDLSSGWRDNNRSYSSDQLTRTIATIARYFEKVARESSLARTTTSTQRPFSSPGTSGVLDALQTSPNDLVEWSTYGTDVPGSEPAVIREEFERLFAARGSARDQLARRLLSVTDAESLVRAAFDQYKERGNAERLVLAASLLEEYRHAAMRPLRSMARASAPECEYFVDALADLAEDVSSYEATADLLGSWSKHPVKDVRLRLIDVSDALPRPLRHWMLSELVNDADDEVAEAAREQLQSHP